MLPMVVLAAGVFVGMATPAGAVVTGIDTPPPTGSGGFYGPTGPITAAVSGSTVSLVVTAEQLVTQTADGTISLSWTANDFSLVGSGGSDTSGSCTATTSSLDCSYTDMAHTYKSVSYEFVAQAPDPNARITATAQTNGPAATETFVLDIEGTSHLTEVSAAGSPTTYSLMHDLFPTSLNDLDPGQDTGNQFVSATTSLCQLGRSYVGVPGGAPDGSLAGKEALTTEAGSAVDEQGCITFARSSIPPDGDTTTPHFDYYAYALDAVAPLVGANAGGSRAVPPTLTLTDMKRIYECKPGYTDWRTVTNGATAPIVRFWPSTGSDIGSFYADMLGFTPDTAIEGTDGDTCTTKPIATFTTVGGIGSHVTGANPENTEDGIVYQASVDATTPAADAISVYSVGQFVQQWDTLARNDRTAINSVTGTAIGNFNAATLRLAQVRNRTTASLTAPFATFVSQVGTFNATSNRGRFSVNTGVVKEANEWYSHMPRITSPPATSSAAVPGVHYLYNVADTALPTYSLDKMMIGFDNQPTGTMSVLCHGDDGPTIAAGGFVPLNSGSTAPRSSDMVGASCREFPSETYPGYGRSKSWAPSIWVSPTPD